MKRKPKTVAPKPASPDALVANAVEQKDIELKEEDLAKVNGGLIALLNKQH